MDVPQFLEHSFSEYPNVLEDFTHNNSPASHIVREDESGKDEQAFNGILLLSQGKLNKVFHKG